MPEEKSSSIQTRPKNRVLLIHLVFPVPPGTLPHESFVGKTRPKTGYSPSGTEISPFFRYFCGLNFYQNGN